MRSAPAPAPKTYWSAPVPPSRGAFPAPARRGVVPRAAGEGVVPEAADQAVSAAVAGKRVIAAAARQRVLPAAAGEPVVGVVARDAGGPGRHGRAGEFARAVAVHRPVRAGPDVVGGGCGRCGAVARIGRRRDVALIVVGDRLNRHRAYPQVRTLMNAVLRRKASPLQPPS